MRELIFGLGFRILVVFAIYVNPPVVCGRGQERRFPPPPKKNRTFSTDEDPSLTHRASSPQDHTIRTQIYTCSCFFSSLGELNVLLMRSQLRLQSLLFDQLHNILYSWSRQSVASQESIQLHSLISGELVSHTGRNHCMIQIPGNYIVSHSSTGGYILGLRC